MNWLQFQAYVWLRWRLMANQWRRGGRLNAVLMTILAVGTVLSSIPVLIGCFTAGRHFFPDAKPMELLYLWDAITLAFLFSWSMGVLTDVHQSESLAITKFLHLPVSIGAAFAINYLSSLMCLTMIVFLPVLLGLSISLIATRSVASLLVLPLTIAFIFMISAISNQFQGWLTALLSNPRRRRAVMMGVTGITILIFQVPNLVNIARMESTYNKQPQNDTQESASPEPKHEIREVDIDAGASRSGRSWDHRAFWDRGVWILNLVLPIGWLPLGVMGAAEGRAVPALLGTLAMTAIGLASLRRAYRTTMRYYQGQFTATPQHVAKASPPTAPPRASSRIEGRLPGMSEPVSAIALAGMWSLLRSPEAKMMLLMPLIMAATYAAIALKSSGKMPDVARPWLGIGAFGVVLFGVMQLMANQFGFDRHGFRVFVLSAASRRDILVGKNLSFVPFVFGLATPMLICTQVYCRMRWSHLLSMAPQYVSMFLMFCVVMNILSIYTPTQMVAGSTKPAKPKLTVLRLSPGRGRCCRVASSKFWKWSLAEQRRPLGNRKSRSAHAGLNLEKSL